MLPVQTNSTPASDIAGTPAPDGVNLADSDAYCMNQPWLTTSDWPVSALDGNDANKQRDLGDVFDRGEFAVDGLLQHDLLDDVVLGDAELLGLLGDLLLDQRRAHEARDRSRWRARRAAAPSLATTLARPIRPCLAVT